MTPVVSRDGRGDRRAELIPAELLPLFDDRFVRTCDLFEDYVHRLVVAIARETRIEAAARQRGTPAEIAGRADLDPSRASVPVAWILEMLAERGLATRSAAGLYTVPETLPSLDSREVASEQERHDPSPLASYRLAAVAAEAYPPVLRGETTGEEAFFAPDRINAWFEYFSNDNALYAIGNRIGAIAAERAFPASGGALLELGGGLGSGAAALVECFEAAVRLGAISSYRFTELAPLFLRRGQRALTARFPAVPFAFGRLDMDRPFAEGGAGEGEFVLVYGVNTLHVARDLECTLGEVRRALAPGGAVVLSECVRPFPGRPVHVELIFNLLEAFRAPRLVDPWRPNGGFLTPEQWTAALEACGFRDVAIYPDIARIREAYPSFIAAAVTAVRA